MTNEYKILKQKHQEEVGRFPIGFAFNNEQFVKAMERLELTEEDTDKVCSIGMGGFIRKTDTEEFYEMFRKHKEEMRAAIENDPTGDGFIFDMFAYELANHEYGYTRELDQTLEALDLTIEEISVSDTLMHGLKKACNSFKE